MSVTENKIALPSKPITSRDRAFILQYRHKNRMGITAGRAKDKVFWFAGHLKEAVERARLHCERMDYTFVYCSPFIVDLEAQEKLKSDFLNDGRDFDDDEL